jgi:hypothetical protein
MSPNLDPPQGNLKERKKERKKRKKNSEQTAG